MSQSVDEHHILQFNINILNRGVKEIAVANLISLVTKGGVAPFPADRRSGLSVAKTDDDVAKSQDVLNSIQTRSLSTFDKQ